MKYREFIKDHFVVDDRHTGELIPFELNNVQDNYYNTLCEEYDIEKHGVSNAVREWILKARKGGITTFVLALFAADDLANEHATQSLVFSYRDDATKQFRKRYRNFILSFFAVENGVDRKQIAKSPQLLEKFAKPAFRIDSQGGGEYELKHNGAHFYCGTASARTAERGGTVQKILFSESAHYPDVERITAKEIIEGSSNEVPVSSGWIFSESTANGRGNYYEETWNNAVIGQSRYRPRFFGALDIYSEKEFELIASQFTDKEMLKQEYPKTPEEAFIGSTTNFTTKEKLDQLIGYEKAQKRIVDWIELAGTNFIDQAEIIKQTLETIEREAKYPLYVGIDIAREKDKTVVTIGEGKILLPRTQLTKVQAIAIDSTGQGDFMPDWFERNTRWYVMRVKFSALLNDILYKNLEQTIENRFTEIPVLDSPERKEFIKQILNLQLERKGRLISVAGPEGEGYFDDYADSWALMEHAYREMKGPIQSASVTNKVKDPFAHVFQGQQSGRGLERNE